MQKMCVVAQVQRRQHTEGYEYVKLGDVMYIFVQQSRRMYGTTVVAIILAVKEAFIRTIQK